MKKTKILITVFCFAILVSSLVLSINLKRSYAESAVDYYIDSPGTKMYWRPSSGSILAGGEGARTAYFSGGYSETYSHSDQYQLVFTCDYTGARTASTNVSCWALTTTTAYVVSSNGNQAVKNGPNTAYYSQGDLYANASVYMTIFFGKIRSITHDITSVVSGIPDSQIKYSGLYNRS